MYAALEAQVKAILLLQTSHFSVSGQVRQGDWSNLDAGYSQNAVLYPGDVTETGYAAANNVTRIWTMHLDLFQGIVGTHAEALALFVTLRDDILVHLQKYPKLNGLQIDGAPADVAVLSINSDEPAWIGATDDSGPFAIKNTLDLRIRLDTTATSAE